MSDSPSVAAQPQSAAPTPPQRSAGNAFGITSLILGIVTMAGFAIPILNYVALATGVVGVVLGIVGLLIKFRPRKAAIAGVILSGLGLILAIILVVVYAAAFTGAAEAIGRQTVPPAGTPSASPTAAAATSTFKNGVLTTPKLKIEITSHRVIAVGEPGNEYGEKPVVAFVYKTTNLTDEAVTPMDFLFTFTAYQDTNPDAVNKLQVGGLPDMKYADSQSEDIKQGGTVENAVAYELDDTTTPVTLTATENVIGDELGSETYDLQ